MAFCVRRLKDSKVEGAFTIEQINQMVWQKQLLFKSFALADTGQGLQAVQKAPLQQWIMLAEVPGYEPDPVGERNCLLIALMILIVVALLAVMGLIKLADILHRIQ